MFSVVLSFKIHLVDHSGSLPTGNEQEHCRQTLDDDPNISTRTCLSPAVLAHEEIDLDSVASVLSSEPSVEYEEL